MQINNLSFICMFKHIRTLLWNHQQPPLKQTSSIASSCYTSPRVPRGNRSPPAPVASSEPSNLVPEHPVPCRIIILLRDWISQKGALDQPKSTNLFKCLFPSSPQGDGQTGSICQSRVHEATCSRSLFFKEGKNDPPLRRRPTIIESWNIYKHLPTACSKSI